MEESGLLLIDKERGPTSADIIRVISRLIGKKHKIGHAGTLDPDGEGLLVVLIGDATKLSETVMDMPKIYSALFHFGVTTDSYDATGQVTATADASALTAEAIRAALPAFTGCIRQTPPAFSAIKIKGKRAYELAREGKTPEIQAREAWVYEFELKSYEPPIGEFHVKCGKGMYLRSLAHDLGNALGTGGHVKSLRRLGVGPLRPEVKVVELSAENWRERLVDGSRIFSGEPVFKLNRRGALNLRRGLPVRMEDFIERPTEPVGRRTGILDEDGNLIAVARIGHGGSLQDRRIIRAL